MTDGRMERVIAAILAKGCDYTACDAFDAIASLQRLKGAARDEMAKVIPASLLQTLYRVDVFKLEVVA